MQSPLMQFIHDMPEKFLAIAMTDPISAVFVTSDSVPPALTVVAPALPTADHIDEQWHDEFPSNRFLVVSSPVRMEFVVEDPQRTDGITTYHPAGYDYDEATEMWTLHLGNRDGKIERRIPRERIVYIEREPDGTDR